MKIPIFHPSRVLLTLAAMFLLVSIAPATAADKQLIIETELAVPGIPDVVISAISKMKMNHASDVAVVLFCRDKVKPTRRAVVLLPANGPARCVFDTRNPGADLGGYGIEDLDEFLLAEDGTVAFRTRLEDPGTSGAPRRYAVWRAAPGEAAQLIAMTGMPAVDVEGRKFAGITRLWLGSQSALAFGAGTDGEPAVIGLWREDGSGTATLAATGREHPSVDASVPVIPGLGISEGALGANGAFIGGGNGQYDKGFGQFHFRLTSEGDLASVVGYGSPALKPETEWRKLLTIASEYGTHGDIAFRAEFDDPKDDTWRPPGLYLVSREGKVRRVAQDGMVAEDGRWPGAELARAGDSRGKVSIASNGRVALMAAVKLPDSGGTRTAAWVETAPGKIRPVLIDDMKVDGVTIKLDSQSDCFVNRSGQVLVAGSVDGETALVGVTPDGTPHLLASIQSKDLPPRTRPDRAKMRDLYHSASRSQRRIGVVLNDKGECLVRAYHLSDGNRLWKLTIPSRSGGTE
jgi:hypothetical protein